MADIILHHYPLSPFAEKVRLALGLKNAAYRSVIIPVWMPKPKLLPLTGGYRRTPVLQIGADIYCDTLLILDVIERLHPEPTLYPCQATGQAKALAWWFEKSVFSSAVGLTASLVGEHFPAALIEERRAFFGVDLSKSVQLEQQAVHRQRLEAHLHWLAQMLGDGRAFLLGDAPSAADLAAYHPIWFVRRNARALGDAMLPLAPLLPWYDRVAGIGHGQPSELSAADALAIARDAMPAGGDWRTVGVDPSGCGVGDTVTVTPDDSGRDPVAGTLVAFSADEVVVARGDPAVGDVHVHFPRAGFELARA